MLEVIGLLLALSILAARAEGLTPPPPGRYPGNGTPRGPGTAEERAPSGASRMLGRLDGVAIDQSLVRVDELLLRPVAVVVPFMPGLIARLLVQRFKRKGFAEED